MRRPTATLIAGALLAGGAQAQTLTAYYDFEGTGADRFDDPAGAFADDLIGQFNPAFSSDTPGTTGSAQSAVFDGNAVLFTDAYTTDLGPDPDAFTIMFWIKARDIEQENDNTRLISTRRLPNNAGTTGRPWQVEGFGDPDNNDGNPNNDGQNGDAMDVRYQPTNGVYPANLFTPDATNALAREDQGETVAEWRHVAFVIANSGDPGDGGAYAQTFVDGSSTGLSGLDPLWDGFNLANTEGQLIIGGDSETAGTRAFVGLLDDVALFAGIVSDADIADIAAGTMSPADFLTNPGIPGDTDGDGDIDDSDLGTAFSNYTGPLAPGTGGKTAADGDTDGDGDVDDSDLGTAFSSYTGPLGPANVPEPTSLAITALGALALARRRRA
ncbi:MAG: LamG-like jellyroll fold domain-containing protein [Phycisphaeraceae bacterium]